MNRIKQNDGDVYSALLTELTALQIQINSSKPSDLKRLLDRQLVIHEVISNRIVKLAQNNQILPNDALQSIVRPPYIITFLVQKDISYNVTVHCISQNCKL